MVAGNVFGFLLLGGLLGLFGQGARAVVGLKTLADYANGPNPGQGDVFNAARLIISLVIGFIAGIAAALAYKIAGGDIDKLTVDNLLEFAGAGYLGTDVIESFIVRYFDAVSATGLKMQTVAAGGVQVNAMTTRRDFAVGNVQKLDSLGAPAIGTKPRLSYNDIIQRLISDFGPTGPSGEGSKVDASKITRQQFRDSISRLFSCNGLTGNNCLIDDYDVAGIVDNYDTYAGIANAIGELFRSRGGVYVPKA